MAALQFTSALDDDWNTVQTSGSTITASNWTGNAFPTSSDDVTINLAGVALTGSPPSGFSDVANSLTIGAGASLTTYNNLTIDGGGLQIASTGTVTVQTGAFGMTGTVTNSGTFILDGTGINFRAVAAISTSGATFSGSGTVSLANGVSGNGPSEITGTNTSAVATLHNVDNTISGFGGIGDFNGNLLALDNEAGGIVNANSSSGTLTIQEQNAVTNAGILEATNSGTLAITSTTVDQTGSGKIEALGSGAQVAVTGGAIVGGALTTSSGGVITLGNGATTVLDNSQSNGAITNSGVLLVTNGGILLSNTLHNSGSVALDGAGNNGQALLYVAAAGGTLDGGGNVDLGNGPNSFSSELTGASTSAAATLHNTDNTISGFGAIGDHNGNLFALDNQSAGVVNADNTSGALTIQEQNAVTNAGILEATNSATLAITSTTVNQAGSGKIEALGSGAQVAVTAGDIVGGLLVTSGGGVITLGTSYTTTILDGTQSNGAVANSGTLQIPTGTLVLSGTLHNAGTLDLYGTGTNATSILRAGPGATIDGGGTITLGNGPNSFVTQITGASTSATTALHNIDNIIAGFGTIGDFNGYQLAFDNQAGAVVNANSSSGTLMIQEQNAVTNAGILEATSNTLAITSTTVNQSGSGTVSAGGSSALVSLNHVTINGGFFTTTSGGAINLGGADTLSGISVTGNSTLTVVQNATVALEGSNSGTLAVYGLVDVVSGASVAGLTVSSGGFEALLPGATTSGTSLVSSGYEYVYSGTAIGTNVSNGAIQNDDGTTSNTQLAGFEIIFSGAAADNTNMTSTGYMYILPGGLASGTDVALGGVQNVDGSATHNDANGFQIIFSGATADFTTIESSGYQYILPGGVADHTIVSLGGIQNDDGTATNTSLGGFQAVFSGASASNTIIENGGYQYILPGGTASATTLSSGAIQNDDGIANGDIISNGGYQVVFAGATASGTTVYAGGFQIVGSGGTTSNAIMSGGYVELGGGNGAGSGGTITFAGGGILKLDDSQHFNGQIAGFGVPGEIDLADIAFGSGTTLGYSGNSSSGTLSVTDGSHTANILLLGQYVAGNFNIASDGTGGTLVTDPPVTVATDTGTFITARTSSSGPPPIGGLRTGET